MMGTGSFGRLAGGLHYALLIHGKPLFCINASRLRFRDLTQYAWPTHFQFPSPQGNHSRDFTNLLSFYAPRNEVPVGQNNNKWPHNFDEKSLLVTELSLLLRTPQQRLPMLFSGQTSRSVQPFLQGSQTWPTDRQTERHARYSVCSNRPHLAVAAMRPNNNNNNNNNNNDIEGVLMSSNGVMCRNMCLLVWRLHSDAVFDPVTSALVTRKMDATETNYLWASRALRWWILCALIALSTVIRRDNTVGESVNAIQRRRPRSVPPRRRVRG